MTRSMVFWAAALLPFAGPVQAVARDCQVRVLQPITDDLGNRWPRGKVLPVTIERDDATGGAYCAHGGSCLPRMIRGAPALRLVNCRVGPVIMGGDRRLVPTPGYGRG